MSNDKKLTTIKNKIIIIDLDRNFFNLIERDLILVCFDRNTNINEISTSLIGQAEHDENSQCILLTKDKLLIKKVKSFELVFNILNEENKWDITILVQVLIII